MEHVLLQLMLGKFAKIFSVRRDKRRLCFLWLTLAFAGFPALICGNVKDSGTRNRRLCFSQTRADSARSDSQPAN